LPRPASGEEGKTSVLPRPASWARAAKRRAMAWARRWPVGRLKKR
jgi:hypothetical protein